MATIFKHAVVIALAAALTACGGGGGSGTNPFGGTSSSGSGSGSGTTTTTTTAAATSVDVVVSAASLGTGVADTVQVTATVKGAGNVAIASAPVVFATDSGSLTSVSATTNTAGQAVATLSAGSDKSNRTITITVTSGAASGTAKVSVVSATPSFVDVVATSNRVGTAGAPVTVTAVVKTASNVALPGAAVSFSTDTGNLVAASSVTDANGSVTATFGAGADKSNRTATIKVVSGAITGTIVLTIEGTTIAVAGPSTLKVGDSNQTPAPSFNIKVTDSTGSAVVGVPLTVTGTLGNIPSGTRLTTDATGTATLLYPTTTAGSDTITVAGAGTTKAASVTVSGQDFSFTAPTSGASVNVDPSGAAQQAVSVRYLVSGRAPADGTYKVRFTTTAGTFSSTNLSTAEFDLVGGVATANLGSRFAGPATVQATVFAPASPNVIVAQASVAVQFVATTPASLVLQLSPTAIGPNTAGTSTQQSEARAAVVDAASNPVAGIVVNFSRVSDPSGGNLLQASATTDADGIARVQYVSGAQSTANGGVVLQATVATNTAVFGRASLTVNQSALFIALGQGNTITNVNPTTYQKQWTAYVTDSTGAPVPNVALTISALPTKYGKGTFIYNGEAWVTSRYLPTSASPDGTQDVNVLLRSGQNIFCPSEDLLSSNASLRNNGVNDPGEDVNTNGRLDPGNVISINGGTSTTTLRTDSTGFALINLQYAESYAYWVEIALKVSATVTGTESSNVATFLVPGAASDYSDANVAPAGQTSPFGVRASCSRAD